jgi:hypothetical protein
VFYFIDEIHSEGLSLRDALDEFKQWYDKQDREWDEIWIMGDASGANRSHHDNTSSYDLIARKMREWGLNYRLRVNAKNPAPQRRIHAVNCALDELDGRIHLFVHPRCKQLIEDLRETRLNEDGEPDKSKSQTNRTHLSDALGYMIEYLRPVMIERPPMDSRVVFQR